MDQVIFSPIQSQTIVDAVLKGYKSYLDERIEKCNTMRVSGGYAIILKMPLQKQSYHSLKNLS